LVTGKINRAVDGCSGASFRCCCLGGRAVVDAPFAEAISAVLLVVVLACAVMRPWGCPEAVAAVPAAGVVIGIGALSLRQAR
jgi:arsenical pump membrane protein